MDKSDSSESSDSGFESFILEQNEMKEKCKNYCENYHEFLNSYRSNANSNQVVYCSKNKFESNSDQLWLNEASIHLRKVCREFKIEDIELKYSLKELQIFYNNFNKFYDHVKPIFLKKNDHLETNSRIIFIIMCAKYREFLKFCEANLSAKEQGENENNVPKFVIPCIAIYECNDSNESIEKEQIIEDQVENHTPFKDVTNVRLLRNKALVRSLSDSNIRVKPLFNQYSKVKYNDQHIYSPINVKNISFIKQ